MDDEKQMDLQNWSPLKTTLSRLLKTNPCSGQQRAFQCSEY